MLPVLGTAYTRSAQHTASSGSRRPDASVSAPSTARVVVDPHFTLPLVPRAFAPPTQQWGNEDVDPDGLQSALVRQATTPFSKDSRAGPPTRCPLCKRPHKALLVDASMQAKPETSRRAVQVDGEADGLPPAAAIMRDFGHYFDSATMSTGLVSTSAVMVGAKAEPNGLTNNRHSSPFLPPNNLGGPSFEKAMMQMSAAQSRVPPVDEPSFKGQYLTSRADRGHASSLGKLQHLAAAMVVGVASPTAATAIELHVAVTAVVEQLEKERRALQEAVESFANEWRSFTWERIESTRATFLSHYYELAKENDELRDQRQRMTILMTPQPGVPESEVRHLVEAALNERHEAMKARRTNAATQCPDREKIVLRDTHRRRSTVTAGSAASLAPSRTTTAATGSPRELQATDSMAALLRSGNKSPDILATSVHERAPTVMFDASTTHPGEFLLQAVGPTATDVDIRDALASLLTRDRDMLNLLRTTTPAGPPVQTMSSHATLFPTAPVVQATPSRLLKPTVPAREPSRLDDTFVLSTDPKPPPKKYVAPDPSPMTLRFYAGTYPDSPRFTEAQQTHLALSRHPKSVSGPRKAKGRAGLVA